MARHRADVAVFAGVPLFDGYPGRQLAPLARHADRLVVTPGTPLAREGARSHQVVTILTGEAVVLRGGREIGRLGPGSVVGAGDELAGTPHRATVVAGSGLSALVLTGPAFRWAVRTLPGFAVPAAA
jgi:CRP/FNR family transcriptional regulator, cyclic AMP receptor protein